MPTNHYQEINKGPRLGTIIITEIMLGVHIALKEATPTNNVFSLTAHKPPISTKNRVKSSQTLDLISGNRRGHRWPVVGKLGCFLISEVRWLTGVSLAVACASVS